MKAYHIHRMSVYPGEVGNNSAIRGSAVEDFCNLKYMAAYGHPYRVVTPAYNPQLPYSRLSRLSHERPAA